MPADATTAIEMVFRLEFPRLVAGLARQVGDLSLAEDLAQDALVAALAQWPRDGTPRNPGAWLMTVGKRKALDRFRRDRTLAAKYAQLGVGLDEAQTTDVTYDAIGDDRLRLIFVACHPLLSTPARTALTLRLVGGLSTAEIARAYVENEPTVAQRIVRAKRSIATAGVPFAVPEGVELVERLGSVLEVIYVIFNEGYAATSGRDWTRPDLCHEALRLGRLLSHLMPDFAEVHGLLALMELQASRLAARIGPAGEPILLADQDRRRWDRLHIHRGLLTLAKAEDLALDPGPYTIQAALAACHARAARVEDTNWSRIVELYDRLAALTPSPIVELNRAVAVGMAAGPADGLALVDEIAATGLLNRYHLLHSVRGDLLARLGRHGEAAIAFGQAAALAHNEIEQDLCQRRAATSARLAAGDQPLTSPIPSSRKEENEHGNGQKDG